jgi:hypothetical protein
VKITLRVLTEILIIMALIAAFFVLSVQSAFGQYGNPYDPYLDYQRVQREKVALELDRERNQILQHQLMLQRFDSALPVEAPHPEPLPVYGY